jgi:hypothetical protein
VKLSEIVVKANARLLNPGLSADADVSEFVASNRVSEILDRSSSRTLLVTALSGRQILRIAKLMDVPGICLVDSTALDSDVIEEASKSRIVVMVSESDMETTCRSLGSCIRSGISLRQ